MSAVSSWKFVLCIVCKYIESHWEITSNSLYVWTYLADRSWFWKLLKPSLTNAKHLHVDSFLSFWVCNVGSVFCAELGEREDSKSSCGSVTADVGAHYSPVSAERDLQRKSAADRDSPMGSLHLIRLRFTALPFSPPLTSCLQETVDKWPAAEKWLEQSGSEKEA